MEQPDQRESAAFSAVLMWLFKIEFGAHTVFRLRCSLVARYNACERSRGLAYARKLKFRTLIVIKLAH